MRTYKLENKPWETMKRYKKRGTPCKGRLQKVSITGRNGRGAMQIMFSCNCQFCVEGREEMKRLEFEQTVRILFKLPDGSEEDITPEE